MVICNILDKQFLLVFALCATPVLFAQQHQQPNVNLFKYSLTIQNLEVVDSMGVASSLEQIEALKKKIKFNDKKPQSIKHSNMAYRMPIYKAEGDFKMVIKEIDTTKDYRLQVIKPKWL